MKKINTLFLSFVFLFLLAIPSSAANIEMSTGLENILGQFVSDLNSNNVHYTVFTSDGMDVTTQFKNDTFGSSINEICQYIRQNTLMIEKYYLSDIELLTEGGTEYFIRQYGGVVYDRNNMFSTEVYYELDCNVTWDSNYGIYSGSCSLDESSIYCLAGEEYAVYGTPICTSSISSDKRTITYHCQFVLAVDYGKIGMWDSPLLYDMPAFNPKWEC